MQQSLWRTPLHKLLARQTKEYVFKQMIGYFAVEKGEEKTINNPYFIKPLALSRNLLRMDLNYQYNFVTSSRQVLLNYCAGISEKDFVSENSSFGRGSIRNLLVHIGNTYEFWIGKHALNNEREFTAYHAIKDVLQAKDFFLIIDSQITSFLDVYSGRHFDDLQFEINNQKISASPLKLFTHVITHEFHHKGQILSLSRHLGYIPIDTDIIR